MLNRFWTKHLFGVENGVMDGPKAVIEREDNKWVEYADWPVPGSRPTTVRFAAGDQNGVGRLGVEKSDAAIRELIVDDSSIDANVLVAAPQSPARLVYQTSPLTAAVHVSGIPSVTIHLAIDKPAQVCHRERHARGLQGIRRALHRDARLGGSTKPESLTKTTPVVPGTAFTMSFELQPHDYVFAAGSRIGVVLLSSDRLFTLRPPPGTRLTVFTGDSSAVLPIVEGEAVLIAAIRKNQ